MIRKKAFQIQVGDKIKARGLDEYFFVTGFWKRWGCGPEGSQIYLEWIDVTGVGRIYNRALRRMFEFDSESSNYILIFTQEDKQCLTLLSMAAILSGINQILFQVNLQ